MHRKSNLQQCAGVALSRSWTMGVGWVGPRGQHHLCLHSGSFLQLGTPPIWLPNNNWSHLGRQVAAVQTAPPLCNDIGFSLLSDIQTRLLTGSFHSFCVLAVLSPHE